MFSPCTIRAMCAIKPNQNYKHLCFREHLEWTPSLHFVDTAVDFLQPMAGLFRFNQTMHFFSQENLQYPYY